MIREREIERKLKKMIEGYGGVCLKWNSGEAGVPDRICLLPGGTVIFVETKKPKGGRLSKLQEYQLDRLYNLGFRTWVLWNDDDFLALDMIIRERAL